VSTVRAVAPERDPYLVGGLAIPFGSPGNRDIDGEYFDADTDLAFDLFPDEGRPVLYHHGLDGDIGPTVVGRQVSKSIDEDGVWIEIQLDKRAKYVDRVRTLLERGALGLSTGAMSHLVRVLKDTGRIVRWPWIETSLTPAPAHPGAIVYTVKTADAIAHLREAGSAIPPALLAIGRPWDAELARIHDRVTPPMPPDAAKIIDEATRTVERLDRERQAELAAIHDRVTAPGRLASAHEALAGEVTRALAQAAEREATRRQHRDYAERAREAGRGSI
jgi:hypothetical protein